jgi:hypothetical protein
MFTIGFTQYGSRSDEIGYGYDGGGWEARPALAVDMRGFDPPQYDFMAFPGEKPPQIKCDEDAGAQDTDEGESPPLSSQCLAQSIQKRLSQKSVCRTWL